MLYLSAGLLAAAAFEAYLNYVGEEILPHVWKVEREFFSSKDYCGTNGKLKRVLEELAVPMLPKGRKPLQSLIQLQGLRDAMVHAKPKRDGLDSKQYAGMALKTPDSWPGKNFEPEKIKLLIQDVEAIASMLHTTLKASEFKFVIWGGHPLLGCPTVGFFRVE